MCVVSAIGDNWREQPWKYPSIPREPFNPWEYVPKKAEVDPEEFEALKKEIEELKKLLKAGKEFDEKTGQPNCELDEKVEFIRKMAEFVGVDMEDVFGK